VKNYGVQADADRKMWNMGISALIDWLEKVDEEGKRIVIFIQNGYQL